MSSTNNFSEMSVADAAELLACEVRLGFAKRAADPPAPPPTAPGPAAGPLDTLKTWGNNLISPPKLPTTGTTDPFWGAAQKGLIGLAGGAALGGLGSMFSREQRKRWLQNAATWGLLGGLAGTGIGAAAHSVTAARNMGEHTAPGVAGGWGELDREGRHTGGTSANPVERVRQFVAELKARGPIHAIHHTLADNAGGAIVGGIGGTLAAEGARALHYRTAGQTARRIAQMPIKEITGLGIPAAVANYVTAPVPGQPGARIQQLTPEGTLPAGVSAPRAGRQLPTRADYARLVDVANRRSPRAATGGWGHARTALLMGLLGMAGQSQYRGLFQ